MAYTTIINLQHILIQNFIQVMVRTNAITGVGFQPDKVWIKERNGTNKS